MKAVILAGGLGTRLAEETSVRPKPMVEIGGKPVLWHILKLYSHHGINDFIICLGYKGYVIKEYFANYFLHMSDVTFDLAQNRMEVRHQHCEPWRVTLVDTGDHTQTGGRLKRVADYLDDGTYYLGRSHYEAGRVSGDPTEYQAAIVAFDVVTTDYADGLYGDNAWYYKLRAHIALGDCAAAQADADALAAGFPDSTYNAQAQTHLANGC